MASGTRRRGSQLRRRGPQRQPYDRVLIVCEDTKSAPRYFNELKDRYHLSTANIKVKGTGADPKRLVKIAKKWRNEARRERKEYDTVYCVFDRDEHHHFEAASDEAKTARLKLARSWPCFEFWLVLHFTYHRRPYDESGNKTAAQHCVKELRQHLPDYTKGAARVFQALECNLEIAKRNAGLAQSDVQKTRRYNPSIEVHSLVTYLQSLKPA